MGKGERLVVMAGTDGKIITFNSQCERVTGFSSKEVVGKNLIELLVPSEWRDIVAGRFKTLAEHELREPHRNPWVTKSGEQRMIEWSCSFLPVENGRIVVGFGTLC